MFGLKKERPDFFQFELEQELQDPKKKEEYKKRCQSRIQEIKKILREGANSEEFESLGILLHGYVALEKLLNKKH